MLDVPALEAQLTAALESAQVPGLALAVIHDHAVIYSAGQGVTMVGAGGVPVTDDTRFRIGSITKSLTATLIMKLVEAGVLDLDVPIARYSAHPGLPIGKSRLENVITLRMLLSHTAGLPTALTYRPGLPLADTITQELPNIQPVAPPNTVYYYSNMGYNLAGYIACAAVASSRNPLQHARLLWSHEETAYSNLMKEVVLWPLNMSSTTFDPFKRVLPLAYSHRLNEDGIPIPLFPPVDSPGQHPCGFALATITDLCNFVLMNLNNGQWQGGRFLSPASIAAMHTPHVNRMTGDFAGYGAGFRSYNYKGVRLVGHNGAIHKYGGWLWFAPGRGTGVVMLCNRAPQFWDAARSLIHSIFDQLLNLPDDITFPTLPGDGSRCESDYAGCYLGDSVGLVRLYLEDNKPMVDWHGIVTPLKRVRQGVYGGGSVSVGLHSREFFYLNGEPCRRIEYEPYHGTISRDYDGIYTADVDTFTLRVEKNTLHVYSDDDRREYACIALNPSLFACSIGTLQFIDPDTFMWANAFKFTRQKVTR